jgi:hypothetical protein
MICAYIIEFFPPQRFRRCILAPRQSVLLILIAMIIMPAQMMFVLAGFASIVPPVAVASCAAAMRVLCLPAVLMLDAMIILPALLILV